jgi:glycosyltransferase involved in cell wall biosynthesis
MSPSILIDLGKLKNLHSGLGQVSLQYGINLLKINQLQENPFQLTYLVPKNSNPISTFGGGASLPPAPSEGGGANTLLSFGEGQGVRLTPPPSEGVGGSLSFEFLSLKRRFLPQFCPRYDLWHAIHQDSPYFPSDRRAPYILTIHDLNFMTEKSPAKAQKYLRKLQKKVNRAQAITFISKFSESMAREHLKLPNVPIEVIYNGVSISEALPQKPSFALQSKFLLAIGIISTKKNFAVLIDFMRLLPDYQLIIAGDNSSEYAQTMRNEIIEKGLDRQILMPGTVSEAEKNWLYTHCEALVFPSKNEGFGMPVIEAMRFGKPVFLSTYSALPEIGGDLAFYWQNFDPQAMQAVFAEKMQYFQQDLSFSEKLKAYARQFNWENNVKQYLQLYQKIINLKTSFQK